MSIQLIDKVKIGPYAFDINDRSEEWHRSTGDYGSTLIDNLVINVVTEDRPAMFVLDTLLHEILHGIWEVWHLGEDIEIEERIVASISTALLGVLQDNAELRKLIEDVINGKYDSKKTVRQR